MDPFDEAPGPVPPDSPASSPAVDSPAPASAPPDVPDAPGEVPWPSFEPEPAPGRRPRRRRRRVVAGALGAAVVGSVSVLVFGTGGSPPGAGMSPAAFVAQSTQTTLSHRTADVSLSGSVQAAGHTLPVHGSGQCDFTTGTMSMEMQEQVRNVSIDIRLLALHRSFYFGFSANGQDLSAITGGPHWVSLPLPVASNGTSLGSSASDPASQLKLLAQQGNTVRPLGTANVDGIEVSGFAVTPSRETIVRGITEELLSTDLPPAIQKQLQQYEVSPPTITVRPWFDANGLLRKMSMDMSLPSLGSSSTNVGGTIDMVFTDYGVPVDVTAPSPADVISFSDFGNLVSSARQT